MVGPITNIHITLPSNPRMTSLLKLLSRHYSKASFYSKVEKELSNIKTSGLWKQEQVIHSPQSEHVLVGQKSTEMINFCANNYLGLSNHQEILDAGKREIDRRGAGMSSVRFICGTQDIHKSLENKLSDFFGTEDTILYTSCFDANAGLFETILGAEDAVISDTLNHASIIDGIRLCKAQRFRYQHNDMEDLEKKLIEAKEKAKTLLIATDGVFSMDGDIANLPRICELARKYDALVFVDDSHATGFIGPRGRGTAEHFGLEKEVDIISSTLGKALGGSSGGFTTGRKQVIDLLRQRSRPYLFSNSLPPVTVAFSTKSLQLVDTYPELIQQVQNNTIYFRAAMKGIGYQLMGNYQHPICPVLIGDATVASKMAADLRDLGMLVIAFSYPVVPLMKARIRVQISASHSKKQLDTAVAHFEQVGKSYTLI